ncbi:MULTISPECIES: Yip1 family protein [Halorussus]|uniref:Yip1 family protein n=1 Tax=Halorussus TaxID=1070314 RepID=UPI0020A0EEBE|nr:Yip1 family protein [Halorussus vallis]USZ75056.1 YIP1 family protein [Halorussus vallis]
MVLQALLHPDDYFAGRSPSLGRAFAVVLVVALITTTAVGAFGWLLSERITATTEIPNQERPPDWVCDGESDTEAESMMRENCDEPKTKTVQVGDLIWKAFGEKLPLLFVGSLLAWPLYAAGLHVASAVVGGRGSFLDTLAVTAWGIAPNALQAVVGLGLLVVSLDGLDLSGSNPEMLASQVQSLTVRARGGTTAVKVAGACWQGYVWTFGLKHARDLRTGEAAIAGGGIALVALLFSFA